MLQTTPLRQQELCELVQAASLLKKALEKAQLRASRGGVRTISPDSIQGLIKAMKFVENGIQTLFEAHGGDSQGALFDLVQERADLPGWKSWASLLKEQLLATEPPEEEEKPKVRLAVNNSR